MVWWRRARREGEATTVGATTVGATTGGALVEESFLERRRRIAEAEWRAAVEAARRGPGWASRGQTLLVGLVIGAPSGLLLRFTDANYVASPEMEPYIVATGVVLGWLALSLMLAVVLWAFGRRAMLWLVGGQIAGLGLAGGWESLSPGIAETAVRAVGG